MKLRRRLTGLLAAAVLAVGVPVITAPAAHASDCAAVILCGRVTNALTSHRDIQVSNAWHVYPGSTGPAVYPENKLVLHPGQSSMSFHNWRDVDAIWVPAPCYYNTSGSPWVPIYQTGNVWVKIPDGLFTTLVQLQGC